MKIAIVHHHFRPGGVTKVAISGAKALLDQCLAIESIQLVSGSGDNLDAIDLRTMHLPLFDYHSDIVGTNGLSSEAICRLLEEHLSDHLLWVHNYQLGKNGYFTQGVLDYARRHPDRPVMLQIHDFPECGRHNNLDELYATMNDAIYPDLPNVLYLTINERDRKLLISCGISSERVALLNNPVSDGHADSLDVDRERIRKRVAAGLPETAGKIDHSAPFFLYPVRTIRRKNVLEAALLARLVEGGANLLVTLPGTSEAEQEYSHLVRSLFADGTITGAFGLGAGIDAAGIGFEELARSCDLVVSSSVQEGFGYFFVDALRWGVPLFARRLDILGGIEPLFEGYPHYLYSTLWIPVRHEKRKELSERYNRRMNELSAYLHEEVRSLLQERIQKMLSSELIDFSYLDAGSQAGFLRCMDDRGLLRELRSLNADMLSQAALLTGQHPTPPTETIRKHFGNEHFASRAKELIEQLMKGPSLQIGETRSNKIPPREDPVHRRLLQGFAAPEYLRLLYETPSS